MMTRNIGQAAREALLDRRRELVARATEHAHLEDAVTDTRGRDIGDQAMLAEALFGLEGLRRVEELELRAIDRALARIADGSYGDCETCGEPIERRRLEAVPWTRSCYDCVARAERQRPGD
jgi:DnaK suppressor protein